MIQRGFGVGYLPFRSHYRRTLPDDVLMRFGPDLVALWINFHESAAGPYEQVPIVDAIGAPCVFNMEISNDLLGFRIDLLEPGIAEAKENVAGFESLDRKN